MNNNSDTFVTDYFLVKRFCPSQKLFVMTDLHGCSLAMNRLLKHYDGQSKVVFLGDAIDRGPDSYAVIKRLIELDAICILGNHEFLSLETIFPEKFNDKNFPALWYGLNGGNYTLDSFDKAIKNGAQHIKNTLGVEYPLLYSDYIRRCKTHYLSGNILFTHAGIPPHENVEFCDDPFDSNFNDAVLWWRPDCETEMYNEKPRVFNEKDVFSVSGHTPTTPCQVRQNFGINLDAGYTLKLALEIEPDSCNNSCRYRIFGTNCDEVNVNKAIKTGQCTNELLLKQEKEAIEKQMELSRM